MRVAKDVHPLAVLFSPVIGSDDEFLRIQTKKSKTRTGQSEIRIRAKYRRMFSHARGSAS